ncbi:MAG: cytochrome C oxidase subunit IV family protein [Sterolibacterium sp.]
MISNIVNLPSAVWAILVALTCISVALVEEGLPQAATFVVVIIAAIKSRFVILHYMEAKHAAKHWKFLYETWNFAVAATIIIGQYMALNH